MKDEAAIWLETYREGIERGFLSLPFCGACEKYHWYPKSVCPHCQAQGWSWKPVSGNGHLFTWTEVRHAFSSDVSVPYTVVLVQPVEAEEIRIVSNLHPEANVGLLEVGMPMAAVFDHCGVRSKVAMPIFRPVF